MGSGFGNDTLALEAIRGINLSGKTAFVTGDCSGIGVEDVAQLAGEELARYKFAQPYAVDEQSAERLWTLTEQMVAATEN